MGVAVPFVGRGANPCGLREATYTSCRILTADFADRADGHDLDPLLPRTERSEISHGRQLTRMFGVEIGFELDPISAPIGAVCHSRSFASIRG